VRPLAAERVADHALAATRLATAAVVAAHGANIFREDDEAGGCDGGELGCVPPLGLYARLAGGQRGYTLPGGRLLRMLR